ncbi:MAG TPA: hypothetical protein VN694_00205 [Caulobacteraceae bacterium]|nr:hypothetical protein [Caulobacteraceae bacterium]
MAEFAQAAAPPGLRMAADGAQALLEQFGGSPLLAQGKINVISLEAIARRLGPKWKLRSELVHEHAQRSLGAQLGAQALVQQISDTDYVVAQPEAPRAAAQLMCLNCLRGILMHFLGEAPLAELTLHEVTRIDADGIYGRPVDFAQAETQELLERGTAAPPPERARRAMDTWTPFVTSTGVRVALAATLEPVVLLKTSNRIGYRIAVRVHHQTTFAALTRREHERLSTGDLERIDFGSIARGLDRLRSLRAASKPPALILPVSYVTVQSRSGRATLISLLRRARAFVDVGLICEIAGVESAPPATLAEAIASLRPFAQHVIGRLSDIQRDDGRHLVGAGLDGISGRSPMFADDADFSHCASGFAKANGRVGKALFLYQVQDMFRGRMAGALGVTHVTLAPQRLRARLADDEPR